MEIYGTLQAEQTLQGTIGVAQSLSATLTFPRIIEPDKYTGSYEVTPSEEVQTLETNRLVMTANVTINPIPNNYGLITWGGSGTSIVIT